MRFKPRIVGAEAELPDQPESLVEPLALRTDAELLAADISSETWDDAAMLGLPDDLAEMAEQLRADAAFLADRFPAPHSFAAAELPDSTAISTVSLPATPVSPAKLASIEAASINLRRWKRLGGAMRLGAALAVVVASSLASVGVLRLIEHNNSPELANSIAVSPVPPNSPNPHAPLSHALPVTSAANIDTSAGNSAAVIEPKPVVPQLIPTGFFREVTGPELDGVLDLLEQEDAGLSI